MTNNWYDTAQVCIKGHVINPMSVGSPMQNKRACDQCGSSTITVCQKCTAPIRGVFHGEGTVASTNYSPPGFCHNCGAAFPWQK